MSQAGPQAHTDLVLTNANIHTVDSAAPHAEALAIHNGRVAAVGSRAEATAAVGSNARTVDLGGRTVIPGIVDNHTHPFGGGATLLGHRVDLAGATSVQEITRRISEKARTTPEGKWIETTFLPRVALAEGRMPTRTDLDSVSERHPIYVTQSGKNAIVNTLALKMAGIDRHTPDPDGSTGEAEGRIVHDDHGEPTGHLIAGAGDLGRARWWQQLGQAPRLFDFTHLSPEECDEAIQLQMREFNSVGITSTRDMGATPAEIRSYLRTAEAGLATCRIDAMVGVPGSYLPAEAIPEALDEYESLRGLSVPDSVRVAGLKILIQNDAWWSLTPAKAESLITLANRRGWTLAFHAGSSKTAEINRRLVELLEAADREVPISGRRFSWEHGLGLFDEDLMNRAKRLGVIIACQPSLTHAGASRSARMGPEMDRLGLVKGEGPGIYGLPRAVADWGLPMRSWLKAGLTVTIGTDWPASRTTPPANPLMNLAIACTQESSIGVLLPDETVPASTALRMATLDGAYSMFAEDRIGSLSAGKLADLVVLDDDPLDVAPQRLFDINVLATVCDGRTVFHSDDLDVGL